MKVQLILPGSEETRVEILTAEEITALLNATFIKHYNQEKPDVLLRVKASTFRIRENGGDSILTVALEEHEEA